MNTAANWDTDPNCASPGDNGIPGTDDTVQFPGNTTAAINNDISGSPHFRDIIVGYPSSGSTPYNYTFSGSDIFVGQVVTTGAGTVVFDVPQVNMVSDTGASGLGIISDASSTVTVNSALTLPTLVYTFTGSGDINLDGTISGSGALHKSGSGTLVLSAANTSYSGITLIDDGIVTVTDPAGLGTAAGDTRVSSSGTLRFSLPVDAVTIAEPLTLGGAGFGAGQTLQFEHTASDPSELTFSGTISLNTADVAIGSDGPLTISGTMSGAGGFTFLDTSTKKVGILTLTASNTYSGMTTVNNIVKVQGTQSSPFTVTNGSYLKGTGTVGAVTVQSGGHVAPGNSPGCLNSGNTSFVSGSAYDVEIAGTTVCTEYDQLRVTGTVDLGGATLNTSLLNGFVPAIGNTFTVIANDGADAVTGTFSGLVEGATFTVGSTVFKISYVGGDGNDVVLTVQSAAAVPGAPKTGLALVAAHPIASLLVSTIAALSLAVMARRFKPAVTKR